MTEEEKKLAVRGAMRDLATALLERNIARTEELLDDEFTGCDPSGVIVSKQQWLSDLASGELEFKSIEPGEIELTALDDAVRVHAQLTFRARYTRSNYNGTFRCLGLYAKRGDTWKLMLSNAVIRRTDPAETGS
jgi:hypothetical protein